MKSAAWQLGDVVFDAERRTLKSLDGRPAPLRNKSKEVLLYLLKNRNTTVPKEVLLGEIWSDVTVSDESLAQCIMDIRRLIGSDARNVLETVPRQGYRINVEEPKEPKRGLPLVVAGALLLAGALLYLSDLGQPEKHATAGPETVAQNPPGTVSTEAYLEVLQGRASANRFGLEESLNAERHFRRAIELDPNYARAFGELATLLAIRFENDWNLLEEADKQKARFFAERAISLDPDLWLGHYAMGRLHSIFGDLGKAEESLRAAMSLRPDNEDARAYLGVVRNLNGDAESAVAILQRAIASHPNPPFWYYFALGHAQFNLRRFVEAEEALQTCMDLARGSPYCLRYMLGVYGATGNLSKAEQAATTYAAMGFDPSITAILDLMAFHHPDDLAHLRWALRQTDLPE